MAVRPIGWICGQVLKNFSGRLEGIQKAMMDLLDEFKDELPGILRLSKSKQKKDPVKKTSKIRMALAVAQINRGTLIQGLNSISSSSKSVAKLLQPQLACRLLELRHISHRLLREVNAPSQPLYSMQASGCCISMSCKAFLKIPN
ncbi:spermatogeneis-associated protein 9 [Cricetulus griseus]|nr:spermatogeneis-associated protein 9 [Cricetulus griseus]